MGHIDKSFLVWYTHNACQQNVSDTVDTFTKLRFVVYPQKLVLGPTQKLEIFGFMINSINMTTQLPSSKAEHVKSSCRKLFNASALLSDLQNSLCR